MILQGCPGETRIEVTHPGGGKTLLPGPSKTVTKHQIADLQTAKSRYQTGKLPTADCRTGKDWKT